MGVGVYAELSSADIIHRGVQFSRPRFRKDHFAPFSPGFSVTVTISQVVLNITLMGRTGLERTLSGEQYSFDMTALEVISESTNNKVDSERRNARV